MGPVPWGLQGDSLGLDIGHHIGIEKGEAIEIWIWVDQVSPSSSTGVEIPGNGCRIYTAKLVTPSGQVT